MQQKLVFMVTFKTTHFFVLTSKGSRANDGWRHDLTQESVSGSRFLDIASSVLHQDKGPDALVQPVNAISNRIAFSHCNPSRVAASSEFFYFASNPNGQSAVGKFRPKSYMFSFPEFVYVSKYLEKEQIGAILRQKEKKAATRTAQLQHTRKTAVLKHARSLQVGKMKSEMLNLQDQLHQYEAVSAYMNAQHTSAFGAVILPPNGSLIKRFNLHTFEVCPEDFVVFDQTDLPP
ncbi:hypothetical protein KIW84_071206 [Lathyrus oleraceus]|uniref:Uncharacterized protein n=1 Tax=Pisum sativum TaxID=3888 RepID=A0A9D4VIE2_PEA|nr:hypothetical protein KIW84_071206 [Pisum sativum]